MPNELADEHIVVDPNLFAHLPNPAIDTGDHIGLSLPNRRYDSIGEIYDSRKTCGGL